MAVGRPDAGTATPRFDALAGVDFTSRPRRAKPITAALGHLAAEETPRVVTLESLAAHTGFAQFSGWLARPGPWLGVFDLPFGLPRELVDTLARERGWPGGWRALIEHYAGLTRREVRDTFAAFCAARPTGARFAHRACDAPAGSSPSMKWVNPPLAYMLHAGVPLLIGAGLHLPAVMAPGDGDARRVALEGYPGLLAREVLGRRSYKSDDRARQTAARQAAREELVAALEAGRTRLGVRLALTSAQREELVRDPMGDRLDAVLCLVQAAWASGRPRHGLPEDVDPMEGWIVSAGVDP
jgi:hypothetical protein